MRGREHITVEVLLDYAENKLDAGMFKQVQAHLASGCKECVESFSFWQRMLPRLRSEPLSAAPQQVLQRAFALIESVERKPSLLERIVAALVFDSRQQLMPAGARDLQYASFKLLFEAPNAHVDLLCERDRDLWMIVGQILTQQTSEQGWIVALHGEEDLRNTETNPFGEFQIQDIKPGRYDLTLQDGRKEIALSTLTL